jgi:hypothetical protein
MNADQENRKPLPQRAQRTRRKIGEKDCRNRKGRTKIAKIAEIAKVGLKTKTFTADLRG